jgi:hypothetical protein
MPNIELLKDAYAIIAGIPEKNFKLDAVLTKCTKKRPGALYYVTVVPTCGTIACAAGWLGMHPDFAAKLNPKYDFSLARFQEGTPDIIWNLGHLETRSYARAMAEIFNLTYDQAQDLFRARNKKDHDAEFLIIEGKPVLGSLLSDKQLFLARVRKFIAENEFNQLNWHLAAERVGA